MQLNLPKTKETFEILKARWREVVFIIALGILSMSINMTQIIFHPIGTLLRILITLVYISFTIIIFMLIIGFQRTVYTEDRKRQSPLVLLREGKHFVLRLVGLALIYTLALACLQILVILGHKACGPRFYGYTLGRIFSLSITFHFGQFDSNEATPSDIPINNSIGLRHIYELQNAGPMPITRRKRACYFIPYFIRIAVSMGIRCLSPTWYDNLVLRFNNSADCHRAIY